MQIRPVAIIPGIRLHMESAVRGCTLRANGSTVTGRKAAGGEMSVTKVLQSVQFVVDREGKPQAALLDIGAWETLLAALEEIQDEEAFLCTCQEVLPVVNGESSVERPECQAVLEQVLWEQVQETYAHRRQHPEEVRTLTVDEWLADTIHPDSSP